MIDPSIPLMAKGIDGLQMLDDGNKLAQLWQGQKTNAEMNRIYKQAGGNQDEMMKLGQNSALMHLVMPELKAQEAARQKALLDQQKTQSEIENTNAQALERKANAGEVGQKTLINRQRAISGAMAAAMSGDPKAVSFMLEHGKLGGILDDSSYTQAKQFLTENANNPDAIGSLVKSLGVAAAEKPEQYIQPDANTVADNATSIKTTGMNNKTSEYVANSTAATAAAKLEQDGKIAQQRLSFDQAKLEAEQKKGTVLQWGDTMYMVYPDNSVKEISSPTGQPITKSNTTLKSSIAEEQQRTQKVSVTLDSIEKLLGDATGSGIGRLVDGGARIFGVATKGDVATAQLGTLGGQLVALMPKMSGPQSDKDVEMYKQMAGKLDDPSIPIEIRRAALQTIRDLNKKYSEMNEARGQGVPYANTSSGAKPNALDFFK